MGNDPVSVKFERNDVDPLWKQPSCTHFASWLWNCNRSRRKSSKANMKLNMGFPTSHQPRSRVTPNFLQVWFRRLTFSALILTKKALKVCRSFIVYKLPVTE